MPTRRPEGDGREETFVVPLQKTTVRRDVVIKEPLTTWNEPLRWWNTYYKASHQWEHGRVEVRTSKALRGYHLPKKSIVNGEEVEEPRGVAFACPHCSASHFHWAASLHAHKGNVGCRACGNRFGVSPTGQMFVRLPIIAKGDDPMTPPELSLARADLLKRVQRLAHYTAGVARPCPVGVEVTVGAGEADEMERLLDDARLKFRRGR